jgi:hypothetical protein
MMKILPILWAGFGESSSASISASSGYPLSFNDKTQPLRIWLDYGTYLI